MTLGPAEAKITYAARNAAAPTTRECTALRRSLRCPPGRLESVPATFTRDVEQQRELRGRMFAARGR